MPRATRADCRRVLDAHDDELSALPGVIGLGIVRAPDGGHAIAVYLRERAPSEPIPRRLDDVPLRVIVQGDVSPEG